MPTRLVLFLLTLILQALVTILIVGFRDFKKEGPLKSGWKKKTVEMVFKFFASILLFIFNCSVTVKKVDVDYSYYLGKDYKKKMK